jgi:hypothetical protein
VTKKQKKARDTYLRRKYNISLQQYEEMFKAQKRRCAICGNKPKKQSLHVDHDHKLGFVRGLLCYRCNYGLGYFRYARSTYGNLVRYIGSFIDKMIGG